MTDRGWICLAILLSSVVLVSVAVALWRISSNLTSIANLLGETDDKLQHIYTTQLYANSTISKDIKGVSEAIYNVYESMFDNAEVTIYRNDREEEKDD